MSEEEVKEKPAEKSAEAAPASAAEAKQKKVNCFTLAEVERELKIVKEKMGGFESRHARALLFRKKELTGK